MWRVAIHCTAIAALAGTIVDALRDTGRNLVAELAYFPLQMDEIIDGLAIGLSSADLATNELLLLLELILSERFAVLEVE